MAKKKSTKKQTLNKISGYILIVLGVVFLYYSLTSFSETIDLGASLFFPVVNSLSSIALVFLGIYVLRIEKWAIVLAGVYGLVSLLMDWWIWGLFNGGLRGIAFDVAIIILIINWWVQTRK